MAIVGRRGEIVTCAGRPIDLGPARGTVSYLASDGYVQIQRGRYVSGAQHEIAELARDIHQGEGFDAGALTNWQQPHTEMVIDLRPSSLGLGQCCAICGAPWYDADRQVYHIGATWRDRPTTAPARLEVATIADLVRQEQSVRVVEEDAGAPDWLAALIEARKLDFEIDSRAVVEATVAAMGLDPDEVLKSEAEMALAALPWWRRWLRRLAGWWAGWRRP